MIDGEVMTIFAKAEKNKRVCHVNKIGIETAFWGFCLMRAEIRD